jgi:hypothetical protein
MNKNPVLSDVFLWTALMPVYFNSVPCIQKKMRRAV